MRILICDDIPAQLSETERAIRDAVDPGIEIDCLGPEKLDEALLDLFNIVDQYLPKGAGSTPLSATAVAPSTHFDDYDIVFLDDNLTHLPRKGPRLTAEVIAGHIRAFSSARYIVSLNRPPDVDFDLRYLIGDYTTRADFAIGSRHLNNRALWTGNAEDAVDHFRPWYWPVLNSVPSQRKDQIDFISERLDKKILEALAFTPKATAALSRHAIGSLSPIAEASVYGSERSDYIDEITFLDHFLSSEWSLQSKTDRETLNNNEQFDIISKIVAASVDRWLRRDIFSPQDVLVDMPHLLSRLPFLLGERSANLDHWNMAVTAKTEPYGLDHPIYQKYITPAKFCLPMWSTHLAFWWPDLDDNEELRNLFYNGKYEWGYFVFLEDESKFVINTSGKNVHEFVAEFDSPWNRRYVSLLPDRNYAPRSRLAI